MAAPARADTGDTVVLTLIFIVAPLCGILGVFLSFFLWVFIGVLLVALISMWTMGFFAARARAMLSLVMGAFIVIGFLSVTSLTSTPERFDVLGSASGDPMNYGNGGNPALANVGATPTPPIAGDSFNWDALGAAAEGTEPTYAPINPITSEAQGVLESYLAMWAEKGWDEMVQYTTPTWRNAQSKPAVQLFYNHNAWILNSWEISAPYQAANADSATFTVVANLSKNAAGAPDVKMQYNVLLFLVDGRWLVDPDSIATGNAIIEPTPYVAPPEATPAPLPTVNPKTTLWYNSDGGSFYHSVKDCTEINLAKYANKMKSFPYSELSKHSNLKPCSACNAPD